jgi:hypothetical protein
LIDTLCVAIEVEKLGSSLAMDMESYLRRVPHEGIHWWYDPVTSTSKINSELNQTVSQFVDHWVTWAALPSVVCLWGHATTTSMDTKIGNASADSIIWSSPQHEIHHVTMRRIIQAFTPLSEAVYRARLYQKQATDAKNNATAAGAAAPVPSIEVKDDPSKADESLCLTLEVPFHPSSLLIAELPPTMRIRCNDDVGPFKRAYYGAQSYRARDRASYCSWLWRSMTVVHTNRSNCRIDFLLFWILFLPYFAWYACHIICWGCIHEG